MGYRTWVSIGFVEHDEKKAEKAERDFKKMMKDCDLYYRGNISFEDNNGHGLDTVVEASKKYPDLLLEGSVDGSCEDGADQRVFRIRNGKIEQIYADITYAPFKDILTGEEISAKERDLQTPGKASGSKFPLVVICSKEAIRAWDEKGAEAASEKTDKNEIDGAVDTFHFDTEEDRRTAIEILQMTDGWIDSAWDTNTLSWIRNGVLCRWNDPGINDYEPEDRKAVLDRVFEVLIVKNTSGYAKEGDDIVLIQEADGPGTAEVYASELEKLTE